MSISKVQVLSLYRLMLRNASKILNYNFREHAYRRITEEFLRNKAIEPTLLVTEYKRGLTQLESIRRIVILNSLYPESASVISTKLKSVR